MVLNQDDYFNLENIGYYCISDDDIRNHDSKWLWSVAYFLNSRLARPLGYHRICSNTYLSFLYSSFTHVNKKIELDYYQEFFKKRFSIITNHQTIQYIYYPCSKLGGNITIISGTTEANPSSCVSFGPETWDTPEPTRDENIIDVIIDILSF